MKTKAVADMIYKTLKENNVNFKEFYVLSRKEWGLPEDCADFHLLLVMDNGKKTYKDSYNIYGILEPINDNYEIEIGVIIKDETEFKTSYMKSDFMGTGVHCVA